MSELKIGDIIKHSTNTSFEFYRQGYLYYKIGNEVIGGTYVYPVEVSDLGTATVSLEEKPITMMRYIRKALENESFVKYHK